MNFLIDPLLEADEFARILESLRKTSAPITITGPSDSQKVHICHAINSTLNQKGIYIAFNEMAARRLYEDFVFFLGDKAVFFPSKEIMLHDVEAKSYDSVFQRIQAIDRISRGDYSFVVTSIEAVAHKLIPKEIFNQYFVSFKMGQKVNLEALNTQMVSMGYERVAGVEGKGQFAVRGGIIDIFSVDSDSAVRIELFDDEVDSIRQFDVTTQRSSGNLEAARILPAREALYSSIQRDGIISHIIRDLEEYTNRLGVKNAENKQKIKSKIEQDIDRLRTNYYFPGIDRLIPYIINPSASLLDYLSQDTLIFLDELPRMQQRIENISLEHQEQCRTLLEKGSILPKTFELFFDFNDILSALSDRRTVHLHTFPAESALLHGGQSFSITCKSTGSYQGHTELLIEDLSRWKKNRNRIIILSGTRGRGERFSESLKSEGIEAVYTETCDFEIQPGQIVIARGSLNKGFEYPAAGFVIVSDREAFGQDRKHRKVSKVKNKNKIKAFTDLTIGDYVVHQAHGIGQYVGIQQLSVDGVKRDYLKIVYLGGDNLYIPTNQMDLLQKYIGTEGKSPRLNKLGGSEWAKAKSRVKESLKELADELIKLYAKRQAEKGHAYSKDTVWQKQFEEAFPYDETEDQLKCIEEIKADMESDRVMDRLLCGDVGYGKTEVAIRAVFKAVMDGKQVAYLVPTTILAQQHYNNFKQRMKEFPVTVEVISRFRTPAEQKKVLKDVKSGVVDVLIGTHRLLQKDIQFKNLGLLVVDEEQRFGVAHKEKIKKISPNVDVLTLTATPIPRTLHMSLVGIKDISVLEDPPEERYPVQTYVMEHNPDVIKDAIIRELARKGQVFYLFNRVRSIHIKASEIQELVPEARLAVAHGQMEERELENIMAGFINGEYDVLVCTTIIESGLDMPNVNTIIVEDADKMGLSQLYQLRGRVGRSNRVAYAYVTYKKDKVLSEAAEKRLNAIREFTEFGSGFKIAMRDLEIRGAGNLLGPEQHGQMETVGYEMYCKLLEEAVRELKGEETAREETEISIDLNVSAYIDDSYISSESQKIEMYKKIASIQDENDAIDIQDELADRFGEIPKPVDNLIQIACIKAIARKLGFTGIQQKGDAVILRYRSNKDVNIKALGMLMDKYKRKLLFTANNEPYITYKTTDISKNELLANIKIMLQDIKNLQES
ncbi:MAG: transcription-repair coupling factor [Clostridia bacterium]|nr:transcription-repair coupling factor [Clostridia bacterium]